MKKEEYYIDANRINAIKNPKITYLHVSKEYALVEKDYIDELLKNNNGWIKSDKCAPVEDGYFIVHCPEYEPSIAITRYDTDLGGWIDYADDEISHWQPLPPPPTE